MVLWAHPSPRPTWGFLIGFNCLQLMLVTTQTHTHRSLYICSYRPHLSICVHTMQPNSNGYWCLRTCVNGVVSLSWKSVSGTRKDVASGWFSGWRRFLLFSEFPSVLWHGWFLDSKGIWPIKTFSSCAGRPGPTWSNEGEPVKQTQRVAVKQFDRFCGFIKLWRLVAYCFYRCDLAVDFKINCCKLPLNQKRCN